MERFFFFLLAPLSVHPHTARACSPLFRLLSSIVRTNPADLRAAADRCSGDSRALPLLVSLVNRSRLVRSFGGVFSTALQYDGLRPVESVNKPPRYSPSPFTKLCLSLTSPGGLVPDNLKSVLSHSSTAAKTRRKKVQGGGRWDEA
jgi:hypothetical protein